MSSEKKDLDGVACRRGGSPSGMLQLSPIAQAVDTCMVQPRVIATSDKIALRVVPFSPGITLLFRDANVYGYVFLAH